MPNEELIKYIKENKEKGFSDDVIKKALLDAGWKEEDVNNGLPVPPVAGTFMAPKKVKTPLLVKIIAWMGLLVGIGGLFMSDSALFFAITTAIAMRSGALGMFLFLSVLTPIIHSIGMIIVSLTAAIAIRSGALSMFLFVLIPIIFSIGIIVVSFGLRKMKKWGLYAFMALTGLSLISVLISVFNKEIDMQTLLPFGVQVLMLIYLLSISKKFV